MRFWLTTGEVDDRKIVLSLIKGLKGWLFGDKGYISSPLFETLKSQGLVLYTKVRKNMETKILESAQKFLLYKRGTVEPVIDQLKSMLHVQHTRHRSVLNFQVNVLGALISFGANSPQLAGDYLAVERDGPKEKFP